MDGGTMHDVEMEVGADLAGIGQLRRQVTRLARAAGVRRRTCNDLALVVSELATNVIHGSDGDRLRARFLVESDGACTIDVFGFDVHDRLVVGEARADRASGGRLTIVPLVVDGIELLETPGGGAIRCTLR